VSYVTIINQEITPIAPSNFEIMVGESG